MSMLIAQITRCIGSVFMIMADESNDKKKIFLYNEIGNAFCAIQYFLLGAITGAVCSLAAILRNIMFDKMKKVPVIILLLYFLFVYACGFGNYSDFISYIPVLLVVIYTLGLYSQAVVIIKYSVILVCLLEIIYDVVVDAYVGIAFCVIDIIVVTISLIKLKKKSKQKNIS